MEEYYSMPRMDKLRCIDSHRCNGIMEYRDYGPFNPKNGYYCGVCGTYDLDKNYTDNDQRESWQKDRVTTTKEGGHLR